MKSPRSKQTPASAPLNTLATRRALSTINSAYLPIVRRTQKQAVAAARRGDARWIAEVHDDGVPAPALPAAVVVGVPRRVDQRGRREAIAHQAVRTAGQRRGCTAQARVATSRS